MKIHYLTIPGHWLVCGRYEWTSLNGFLTHLRNSFLEANVALNTYKIITMEIRRRIDTESRIINGEYVQELSDIYGISENEHKLLSSLELSMIGHSAVRKYRHDLDPIPEVLTAQRFLSAKSCVFAFTNVRRAFSAMKNEPIFAPHSSVAYTAISDLYPDLIRIRDSLAHVDERIQGKSRRYDQTSKKMKTSGTPRTAIDGGSMGLIMPGFLNHDTFQCIGADGQIASLPLTDDYFATMHHVIEAFHQALPWIEIDPWLYPEKP